MKHAAIVAMSILFAAGAVQAAPPEGKGPKEGHGPAAMGKAPEQQRAMEKDCDGRDCAQAQQHEVKPQEDKVREDKDREDKIREEKVREEKQREEKVREEKSREETPRDDAGAAQQPAKGAEQSSGLQKQAQSKDDQERKEAGKGSEKGQQMREEHSRKWWKFWSW